MKKGRKVKGIMLIILLIMIVFGGINFYIIKKEADERLATYKKRAKIIETSYGKMSYIEEGKGEAILSCHGICGGYDQAFDTLANRTDSYRIIAPSRFGYIGSDMPKNATIEMQVNAYVELLDALHIDKTYVLATSAGGTSAIKFALMYPERIKGLILYCSAYPNVEAEKEKLTYAAPPSFLCNDFCMWMISPLFKPIMGIDKESLTSILPMKERKEGIVFDGKVTNTVMVNDYNSYNMSKLQIPVLIMHSKDDKLSDFDKAEIWSNKIPNCTAVFFESGGHVMTGNSSEIDSALDRFIKDISKL